MAAAEVSMTIHQAKAIHDKWPRRAKYTVTVRQEGNDDSIVVSRPGKSQVASQRIKRDGSMREV
jgi:hypothetical protein